MRNLIVTITIILLSGCLIVPGPKVDEAIYEVGDSLELHLENLSRSEILEVLGRPDQSLENDTIWIYSGDRVAAKIIATGYLGPVEIPIHDYRHSIVEFSQDSVIHFTLLESRFGCTTTGICFTRNADGFPVWTGTSYLDSHAKHFRSIVDKCSLYVYVTKTWGKVLIESPHQRTLDTKTFAHFVLQPGDYKLTALSDRYIPTQTEFECKSGSIRFAEVNPDGKSPSINYVEDNTGRSAILERSRILLP